MNPIRPADHVVDHPTLLPLSERVVGAVRWTAFVWALGAIAGLLLATELGVLDYQPGGDAYGTQQRRAFIIAFALAIAVSWVSEVVGGLIASASAAAILVFARQQLEPLDATIVVVVFAVPGVLWILLFLHDLRPRAAVASLVAVALAVAGGVVLARRVYASIYGPTHPETSLDDLPESDVTWIWSGAVTSSGATVVAELDRDLDDDPAIELWIDDDPTFGSPAAVEPDLVDPDGAAARFDIVRFSVTGLVPDTEYHYAIELDGELRDEAAGRFRTFPDGPASFIIAAASCARTGSNGAVFDAIRELDPLLFVHDGDFHYANIDENDVGRFLDLYREQLTRTAQAALYRSTPIAYVWDDHDYGADNADATSPSRPAAMESYRAAVPHYPLAGDDSPIHQAFTIGRVRVIVTDTRSARSPSLAVDDERHTMLGEEQLAWLQDELLAADARYPVIVLVNPNPWIAEPSYGGDDWGGYSTERAEIADFIAEHGIDGIVMVSGDAHMVAIDDGTHSDYSAEQAGGFPVLHAAALDRSGSVKGGPYSEGAHPGGGQFGLVEITDDGGDEIGVRLSGRTWDGDEIVAYDFDIGVE